MDNKDKVRLKDLEILLDFHTKMENKGMVAGILAEIKSIKSKK